MRPVRLILIRHGHVAGNSPAEERVNGWSECPLSPLGRRQARALRRRLALEPPAAALYSSPLRRAADTARALEGLPLGPLRLLPELREMYCGELDGFPAVEAQQRYPDIWETNRRQEDEDLRWPGGETYREFRQRCLTGLRRIVQTHPGERVVVVTHAGVISQILGAMHGLHSAQWASFRPGNASLTEVEWGLAGGTLLLFDDRSHLEGLEDDRLEAAGDRPGIVPAGNL